MRNETRWLRSLAVLCAAILTPAAALADPVITGFSADQVPLQSFIQIYGSGFGDAQGQSYVLIGGRFVPVMAWSDGAINALVNPLAFDQTALALDTAYPVQVVIPSLGQTSNTVNLTITSQPPPDNTPAVVDPETLSDQSVLNNLQSDTFCSGSSVGLYGSGFGETQGAGYVSITVPFLDSQGNMTNQEYAVPVLAWSENAIYIVLNLPPGAQLGAYTVTVHRGNGNTASTGFAVAACP
jgi:hypothetical protein